MTIAIREADIERDGDALCAFLAAQLRDHGGVPRYDWLYRRNPFGKARAWIALDQPAGKVVGAAAAFPRPILVDGRTVPGWNLGDFAVDAHHRTLGPAVRLQRALLDAVTGSGAVAYDHPSASMLAVYRWLKVEPAGTVVRYAKPLALDDRWGGGGLSRLSGAAAGAWLSLVDRLGRPRGAARTAEHRGRFPEAVEALVRRAAAGSRVLGLRNAAYLDWRYLDSPRGGHEVIAVVGSNDEWEGFAVIRNDGRRAVLREIVAVPGSDTVHALVGAAVTRMRHAGVQTLDAPLLDTSPHVGALGRWGFHPREATPFVVVCPDTGPAHAALGDGASWLLSDGDRDV